MSIPEFLNALQPNKKILLVKKITEKTREGKINWQKTPNGFAAYVPGILKIIFVDAPAITIFTNVTRWVIFVVRDEVGTELLKVENQTSAIPRSTSSEGLGEGLGLIPPIHQPSLLTMLAGDPLTNAVTELYNIVVTQVGTGGVDKAIDQLEKL
jgi:hypothetical protein